MCLSAKFSGYKGIVSRGSLAPERVGGVICDHVTFLRRLVFMHLFTLTVARRTSHTHNNMRIDNEYATVLIVNYMNGAYRT